MDMSRVYTKWGWVSPEGHHRIKTAYDQAVAEGKSEFMLDGHPFLVSFVKYLLEFLVNEGSQPVEGASDAPLFWQSEGSA